MSNAPGAIPADGPIDPDPLADPSPLADPAHPLHALHGANQAARRETRRRFDLQLPAPLAHRLHRIAIESGRQPEAVLLAAVGGWLELTERQIAEFARQAAVATDPG